jgi:hypothetical protein
MTLPEQFLYTKQRLDLCLARQGSEGSGDVYTV